MRNKIAFRLMLYFSAAVLLFSVVIGFVFVSLFRSYTIKNTKAELEKRAVTIADTLSGLHIGSSGSAGGAGSGQYKGMYGEMGGGYGAYLRFIDDIAMSDVWIVDENLQLITSGPSGTTYNYAELPKDAETVVKNVFSGSTTFSEGFSDLLKTPTLTVGTPIRSSGQIVGALLLHTSVDGITDATAQGVKILAISILAALLFSLILSIFLSFSFTNPLNKMKRSAISLADGNYGTKTEVKQNDEIGELASAIDVLSIRLDEARKESEKLEKLRREFVANVSHELKTPVTVLRGSLEAICDGVVTEPEQVESYHRNMLKETIYLQRLVSDLLDLSRLQNTDFKIEMQELNIVDVLSDAVRSAGQMALKKEISVNEIFNGQSLAMIGDYGRLRQMFLIILDNAVKFSPKGGIVTVTFDGNSISIRDNGPGIPENDLPYIFDRFYKARSEENKSGSGLGLAIAKQIADRHNIKISVISKINEGTEFRFEFGAEKQE